jgi:hypothetical protein
MTVLYPRARVKAVVRSLSSTAAHRIVWKSRLLMPLAVQPARSRFCDGRSYAVLYAASDFDTAFVEVVVRDRLVQRDSRTVPIGEIVNRGWVEVAVKKDENLNMIDLRESGCLTLGAPTDAAHARNQAAGRALSRTMYEEHPDTDGIWYRSRLTGRDCWAVFDRALDHLVPTQSGELADHPQLPGVLRMHGIGVEIESSSFERCSRGRLPRRMLGS